VTSGDFTNLWDARVQRGLSRRAGAVATGQAAPPMPARAPGDQRTFSSMAGGAGDPPLPQRPGLRTAEASMADIKGMVMRSPGQSPNDPRQGVHEAHRHSPFPLEFAGAPVEQSPAKMQDRMEMSAPDPVTKIAPYMPAELSSAPEQRGCSPSQEGTMEQSSTGLTHADLNRIFGEPFGDLFSNQNSPSFARQQGMGGIPSPPPAPPNARRILRAGSTPLSKPWSSMATATITKGEAPGPRPSKRTRASPHAMRSPRSTRKPTARSDAGAHAAAALPAATRARGASLFLQDKQASHRFLNGENGPGPIPRERRERQVRKLTLRWKRCHSARIRESLSFRL
jgi:hypothetical protein